MKSLYTAFLILLGALFVSFIPQTDSKVWLCVGGNAHAYHTKRNVGACNSVRILFDKPL